ncbi:malate dehydrogenase [Nostoc sphaeroides]|uniref:LDH, L-lactate dehydrogenase n=1 Tax=Nostoc sphaeroides CCNUC1 TaxID=2653204 RepID=A0A5P8WDS8_9NOSO|nr:hypothetical protein [Nostoc sphaeroides]QFS50987.1 LDH, L-lactate dehydrogenase [Nostoc sphaeroides CCNUC1]
MSSKTSKVGVIGAGNVGADVANALVLLRKCVKVVLFDRTLSKAEGQAWDIEDSIPLLEEMEIIPSNKYEDLADSDVIVVTVGVQPKLGQSRLDTLSDNAEIIRSTMKELDRVAPNSIVLIVSNPVDVLTRIAIASSTRAENLIFGSGTVLDTARLRYQLGKRLNVAKQDVHVYVIGEHGDSEFVVWSRGLPKNKSFQKNKRQVFSRMIIILRGGEKRVAEGNPFLPLSPSSMHEESIHLSSTLKLNSVKLVCFVAK